MKQRHLILTTIIMLTLTACAQVKFTAMEQQQISVEDPQLFERSDAFTIDFTGGRDKDYAFPLPAGEATGNGQWWCYPLPGAKVISNYGRRGGRQHTGTDLKTKPNDNILAAFDGEVVFSCKFSGYGNLIRIKHPCGLETYYSHNSKNLVKVGDRVKAGQVIALTGRTGRATTEHLHFETRMNGRNINSDKYFDHQNHTIRLKAFKKTSNGYVAR